MSKFIVSGNMGLITWARNQGCDWDHACYGVAGAIGDFAILDYLWENNCDEPDSVFRTVFDYGVINTSILDWFLDHFNHIDSLSSMRAIKLGSVEVMQWLYDHGICPGQQTWTIAAWHGHVNLLEWLYGLHKFDHKRACVLAMRRGHLNVLEWFLAQGIKIEMDLIYIVLPDASLEVSKWLWEHGEHNEMGEWAVQYGDLDTVEWLIGHGLVLTKKLYRLAGSANRLDIVELLLRAGCPH